ncbi:MAG: tetratricopeptide repeat protein [Planctomycetes bacterium]|nr:tetratricopeptide repeat protein [Planctomycetota bacterium]
MPLLAAKRAPLVLLVILMIVAYGRIVSCGFIWDDDDYVTNNPVLRTFGGLWDIWFVPTSLPQYYPLVHTTFWLEYRLWELHPLGYHLVNVVLHACSALVILRLGRRLAIPGILLGALWFAVHPVHVESVAWVTERKNVLSLLCYLLAAERWLRWHDGDGLATRQYAVGSLWFLGALLSKTVTASLPAALLVVIWWRDGRLTKRAVLAAVPWLVIGAALGWFTVHLEATHVGAAGEPWQITGLERVLVAGRACWFYLYSLAWPFGTMFNYPRWHVDVGAWWQWLYPIGAVVAVLAGLLLRGRIGRGPAAALLIFGGTLFPAIGFFDVYPFRYSFVADHFQYHASVAIVLGLAALAAIRARRLNENARAVLGGVFLLAMAITTATGIPQYRDFETLWRVTLEKNPRSAIAHTNLGAIETDNYGRAKAAGRTAEATRHLEAAQRHLRTVLEIDDTSHEARTNLGVLAHQQGDREQARQLYEEALRLKENDPGTWSNLAMLELEQHDAERALVCVDKALAFQPDHMNAHIVRGWVLCELRRFAAARPELEWVLGRMQQAPDVRRRYIGCLHELGEHQRCVEVAMPFVKARPNEPEVRRVLVRSLARLLQDRPEEQARAFLTAVLERGGLSAEVYVPEVAAALRALGDELRARRLEGR